MRVRSPARGVADALEQRGGRRVLADEPCRTTLERRPHDARIVERRDDQHPHPIGEHGDDLDPVLVRQIEIEQREIDLGVHLPHRLHDLRGAPRLDGDAHVAFVAQQADEPGTEEGMVVADGDPDHRLR